MRPHYPLFFLISALVLGLDIFTKTLALNNLEGKPPIEVIPGFFNLVMVHNRGAAFGFLNNPDSAWQIWLFMGVTLISVGIIFFLLKSVHRNRAAFTGLALILGGALGNLVDRVRYHAVVDFLDFYLGGWHWPAFNVADIAICVGAGLTLIALWKKPVKS